MEIGKNEQIQYPAGYEHLSEKVRLAKTKVSALEEKLRSLPDDKNPAPRLRPGGEVPFRYSNPTKGEMQMMYGSKIEQLKKDTLDKVDKGLAKASPEERKQVRALALEELYPNLTKNLKAGGKDKLAGEEKGIDLTQDHMDTQIHDLQTDSPEAGRSTENAVSWKELEGDSTAQWMAFDRNGQDATHHKGRSQDRERD